MMDRRSFFRAAGATALVGGTGAVLAPSASAYVPRTQGERIKPTTWQQQYTTYWCGPAAARMAISARTTALPSQQALATAMRTTANAGTSFDWMRLGLTANVPGAVYTGQWMGNEWATATDVTNLWNRATKNVDDGYATVCNWVVNAWQYPYWGGNAGRIYHYVTVDGYDTRYRTLRISDPAGSTLSSGLPARYWLKVADVASYCAGRGYFW